MSDTDYIPSHMDSISETQSGNDSPVFVGTPTTQQQRKSRAKKKQYLHQEKESALHSEQEVHEPKSVENENKKRKMYAKVKISSWKNIYLNIYLILLLFLLMSL